MNEGIDRLIFSCIFDSCEKVEV